MTDAQLQELITSIHIQFAVLIAFLFFMDMWKTRKAKK